VGKASLAADRVICPVRTTRKIKENIKENKTGAKTIKERSFF
jgi:hypothetical protein